MNQEGRTFGYARVSTQEQNPDRQILELEQYVDREHILIDKASGKNLERENYQALKGALGLRPGDTLYVTSLDRLSRSKQDIKQELEWFQKKKIRVKILDLPTSLIEVPKGQEWIQEMITNILVEVLSSIAEQERLTIRKRQREGIQAAKQKGKHLGRPKIPYPADFPMVYEQWKQRHLTAAESMRRLGLSSSTFYRMVAAYET